MKVNSSQKNQFTEKLRLKILENLSQIQETDDAEASLCTLSFQSLLYPNRHAWLDTEEQVLKLDLEDWDNESEWDSALARVTVPSDEFAIDLLRDWFMNESLDRYSNLNQSYEFISKKLVIT